MQQIPPPAGVKVYVTGPTPLSADLIQSGDHAVIKITIATVVVISIMLLLVYRSVSTVLLVLATVGIELTLVRGVVALLGDIGLIKISTFAISILVCLAIAAGTDYAIFLIGRYHEARHAGQDRETAYYTAYRGVAHVILASGLTIAGATYCLSFTRLPIFQTMGAPCAVGMLVAVATALTLIPAVLSVASRFGLLEPKRTMSVRGWRRVGTAIVRWPAPIFVASCAVALVGLLALPGYRVNYEDRTYMPKNTPANIGWAAADRHYSEARMRPEVLMVESDHDMRNSKDFLVLNKVAKAVFGVQGVARVQGVTRPEGTPLEHTSLPFLLSMQSAGQLQNLQIVKDRIADMNTQADKLGGTIASMEHGYALMQRLADTTHRMIGTAKETFSIAKDMRDDIADFDDTFRPVRSYFYAEKNCYNIPVCWGMRSAYDSLDGVDKITQKLDELSPNLDNLDSIMPQLLTLLPPQIAAMKSVRTMMLTMHSTMSGIVDEMEKLSGDATAMGQDFDAAQNDDSFYLPRGAFDNPDFQRVINLFLSPDGKAARFFITHKGNPGSEEGISRIAPIETAAQEAIKGTPLANATVYVAGTAAVLKDLQQGSKYDLLIAGTSSLCLIFIIMLIITRSFVAALVIVGTVAAFAGGFLRGVCAGLAGSDRLEPALDGAADVDHHSVGRRSRLQPALGRTVQGGNSLRAEYRHHSCDGRYRQGGDYCGFGIRLHHGLHDRQRCACGRPGRHHYWLRSAIRHAHCARVPDAVDCGAARSLVLVATERSSALPQGQIFRCLARQEAGRSGGEPSRRVGCKWPRHSATER